jgi:hypothetical protein
MELDDLKQTWKQTETKKNINTDVMKLIQHKSYGPIAALKREFRKQIIVMMIIPLLLVMTNADDIVQVLTSVMFWSYVAFCIGVVAFAYYNYRIVKKMETMDGMVRSNLEQQVNILETRLKWKVIGVRIALLYFILLTEIVPYFQHYRMLDKWHALSPAIRFGSYAALLLLQYFVSGMIIRRKFGTHLNYLKDLVREIRYE